ncbi:hypothetical protein INR77_08465 [Erythrobacter sp. SCSIO 43205]|uniref:hypothetical protein n=1 Tax=Erythrobacter sp. SCSIO 43205 TaxID=2779361 RepID=UPI001CA973DE|nr:hypothetical protein [Erythrobacter sp. SCSIO 43205]UAB76887.1 hypothetical protein INR77_08465 [Erythrobacter sp. SCSIO 43205]
MSNIIELNMGDIDVVCGGNIVREIEEAYPGGVWIGNSYYPNGVPEQPWAGPVVTGY